MKKFIFGLLLGLVIAAGVGVVAYSIASKDVSYDNTNSGSEKNNVQEAIDELYVRTSKSAVSYIDYNNLIYQQSYNNVGSITYTATEDCYVLCYPRLWAGRSATITVNGVVVIKYSTYSTVSYGVGVDIPIPAKKGDVVTITFSDSTNGTNYIRAYGLSDTLVGIPN